MNIITIAGNITKDAELRYMTNGDAVAGFSVADNQGKDKQAIFWNCSLFGKRGESLSSYLTKGQPVTVVGNVTERKWTDKDGVERIAKDVRVIDVTLQGGNRQASAPKADESFKFPDPPKRGGGSIEDDIPFSPLGKGAACHTI